MPVKSKHTIRFKQPMNPDPRAHLVLFAEGTPFKPKVVESKKKYVRKSKHRNQGENDE
jgi:hypothetical protein